MNRPSLLHVHVEEPGACACMPQRRSPAPAARRLTDETLVPAGPTPSLEGRPVRLVARLLDERLQLYGGYLDTIEATTAADGSFTADWVAPYSGCAGPGLPRSVVAFACSIAPHAAARACQRPRACLPAA